MPINPRMHSSPSRSRFGLRSCGRRDTTLTSTITVRYTHVGTERCVGGVSLDTIVTGIYVFYGECGPRTGRKVCVSHSHNGVHHRRSAATPRALPALVDAAGE